MNKEFIPYDLAIQFRELGFDEECIGFYNIHLDVIPIDSEPYTTKSIDGSILYQQAFRWFREKHNLFSFITTIEHADSDGFDFTFWIAKYNIDKMPVCSTYEEAELACLKEMIKIIKNK